MSTAKVRHRRRRRARTREARVRFEEVRTLYHLITRSPYVSDETRRLVRATYVLTLNYRY